MAKDLLSIVIQVGQVDSADLVVQIAVQHGMKQESDRSDLEELVDDIIAKNPERAASVKANPKAADWFVGQAMKARGGKANPQILKDIVRQKFGI